MKTLLCYGDSNTHGTLPLDETGSLHRLGPDERWPGVVRQRLGADWFVVEEGLNGRTTVLDDPIDGVHKNGLAGLPMALESHQPIDLVVLMLGTNDLKARFAMTALDIARANAVLVERILGALAHGPGGKTGPNVLLVAPPHIIEEGRQAEIRAGAAAKAERFGALYAEVARTYGIPFLDAATVIQPSPIDGVHFDAAAHHKLGNAIADRILSL